VQVFKTHKWHIYFGGWMPPIQISSLRLKLQDTRASKEEGH